MGTYYPDFFIQLGEVGVSTVYIQDDTGEWHDFNYYESFSVVKKLNQVYEFELHISDVQDDEKLIIKEHAIILFTSGTTTILKGRIQTVEYGSAYECIIKGYGMESLLLDKEVTENSNTSATWSDSKRGQWDNISAKTIAKELLSENTDGLTPWIIEPDTSGIFATDFGTISMRYEYANRLNALGKLSDAMQYDWWVANDQWDYDKDWFYISSIKGEQDINNTKTYNITGIDANCTQTSYERDTNNLVNYVSFLGYGDGNNQLSTFTYSASTVYTTLNENLSSSDATITISDATSFTATGTIRIAEEQISYTGKSGNDLTGCTRGINSTVAKVHKKGCYLEQYYASSSPQSGSSIDTYGLMDSTVTDKSILDIDTLEVIASKHLLERINPVIRIKIIPNEPFDDVAILDVGDKIRIIDSESGLNTVDYRIMTITYTEDSGQFSMEIEASNYTYGFVEQLQKEKEKTASLSKYMQGATNIFAVMESENAESVADPSVSNAVGPIDLFFSIPDDAIAINKVTLAYRNESPRTWEANTASGGSSTPTSGNNSTNTVIVASGTVFGSAVMNSNTWTTIGTFDTGATDIDGIYLYGYIDVPTTGGGEWPAGVSGTIYYRFYDGASYYPSSNGASICGGYNSHQPPESLSGFVCQFVPGNQKSKTFTLQTEWADYPADIDWTFNYDIYYATISRHTHTVTIGDHTHAVTYDINTQSYTTTDIRIFTTDDANGSPTWTERTAAIETALGRALNDANGEIESDIDLTSYFSSTGWKGIRLAVDGNSRHKVQANIKCFIESK